MYYCRWDIVEAHYWWCADHHGGQWSDGYAKLCRIGRYFNPGAMSCEPETDNARAIYNALCLKEGCEHRPLEIRYEM
jgi:hypothetical protein